ncbi:MAG TPA: HEAT repeat domain-containing protein [Thermoleophilaceae bacterium]
MAGELRRSDLLVLAALGRGRELDAAAIRKHARLGRLRTRAALKRLCERGLVRSAHRDDRSLYSMTGAGSSLGATALAVAALRHVERLPTSWLRSGSSLPGDRLFDRSPLSTAAFVEERGEDVEALADLVARGHHEERVLAIRALGALRRRECTPILAEVLATETDEAVAALAARELTRSGGPEAVDALMEAAGRGSSAIRAVIADALGVFGEERSLDLLIELAGHRSADVRKSAVRAIGRTGSRRGVGIAAALLADDDFGVRWEARDTLAELGGADAVAALRGNPRRSAILRWRDAFRAWSRTRAVAAVERRPAGPVADRLATRHAAATAKAVALAAALVALDLAVLGASPFAVAAAAVPGIAIAAVAGGRSRRESMSDPLDAALARLQACPAGLRPRSRAGTAARMLRARPLFMGAVLLLPLLADAAMAGIGIAPGLFTGFMAVAARSWAHDARSVRRFERSRGVRLCTWTEPVRRCCCDVASRGGQAQ